MTNTGKKQLTREQCGWTWLEHFLQDVRYSVRTWLKTPAFAAAVVLTMAGGIGAATAIFTVVNAVLLQRLPFRDPDRLVTLWTTVSLGMPKTFVGVANYVDWREQNRVFEDIGLTRPIANFNLTGSGTPERLEGARISENVLPVLGVEPLLGRNITEEERRTDAAVVLLSYGLWQRRFAGDQSILGRKILLNGTPFEVIGVIFLGFNIPGGTRSGRRCTSLLTNCRTACRSTT